MATNSNNQSFLNKSRLDKFIMVFQVPEALKKIESKTERRTYNLNEDAFQFSVYGSVVPEITVPSIQIGYAGIQSIQLCSCEGAIPSSYS